MNTTKVNKALLTLDEEQLRKVEGGVYGPDGCIPPIFDGFPFPISF